MTDRSAPPVTGRLAGAATRRLDLRPLVAGDVDSDELAAVFAPPEVWRFPFGRGFDRAETEAFIARQTAEWEARGFGVWAVRLRDGGRLVGYAGLSVPTFLPEILPAVELGWRLHPDVWGRGYATEAAAAARDAGFGQLGLERLCAVIQPANGASAAVARRLGMVGRRRVTVPASARLPIELEADLWEIDRPAGTGNGASPGHPDRA